MCCFFGCSALSLIARVAPAEHEQRSNFFAGISGVEVHAIEVHQAAVLVLESTSNGHDVSVRFVTRSFPAD